jgi:dolichyl-phosphate beta-glucosyltransferase
MNHCQISFVVPCFNDAVILRRNLPVMIDYLRKRKIDYEMIIVDDGSDDPEECRAVARDCQCVFLSNARNAGKGAAVRAGMLAARGEYCFYTDADVPFCPDAVDRFIHYLNFKEFDIVVGDRTLPQSRYFDNIAPLRRIASRVFSFLVGRFVAGGFFDTQCGLKGFRSVVARDIFSLSRIDGFAFDIEIIYVALKRNYDIKRLPVRLRSNEGTSVKLFRHGLKMFSDIFLIKFNHILGRYRN